MFVSDKAELFIADWDAKVSTIKIQVKTKAIPKTKCCLFLFERFLKTIRAGGKNNKKRIINIFSRLFKSRLKNPTFSQIDIITLSFIEYTYCLKGRGM